MLIELGLVSLCATGVSCYYCVNYNNITKENIENCLSIFENKVNNIADKIYNKINEMDRELEDYVRRNYVENRPLIEEEDASTEEIELVIKDDKCEEMEEKEDEPEKDSSAELSEFVFLYED